ncbi:hypothetical protein GW17_00012269 [Ensete ventricosum]|nr:hypothetical protein GW17_00012269 [Ensete ventricosum]
MLTSAARMRSVINHLKGSRDFPRLRIGIGRPPGKMDPASFVLRPFNRKEREEVLAPTLSFVPKRTYQI